MIISDRDLKRYLIDLKVIMRQEENLNNALYKMSPDFGGFSNNKAIDCLLSLLKVVTNDEYDLLTYYIFELEWGKLWKEGMITDEFGNDIPLKTLDDLIREIKLGNKGEENEDDL